MKYRILRILLNKKEYIILSFYSLFYMLYHVVLYNTLPFEQYPYIHQDMWRRIQDAQFFLGSGNYPQMHPPLPSLLYATMMSVGITQFYLLNIINMIAGIFIVYALAREISKSRTVSLLTVTFYFFSFSILKYNNYYGLVDLWAAHAILAGIYFFVKFTKNNSFKNAVMIGISLGIASIIQYSGLFVLPMMYLHQFFKLRKNFFQKENLVKTSLYTVLSLLPLIIFSIFRGIVFGNPAFSRIDHFIYFRFTIENVPFYTFGIALFFSIPVVILAALGMFLLWKKRDLEYFTTASLFLPFGVFFILFYVWEDTRFLVYISFPIVLAAATGFHLIMQRTPARLKFLAPVVLFLILMYSNLHSQGEPVIPIFVKQGMLRENSGSLIVKQFDETFSPYYGYMADYASKIKTDPELHYYNGTVNTKENFAFAREIAPMIQGKKTAILFSEERFVRLNQFLIIFSDFKPDDFCFEKLCDDAKYIITDKKFTNSGLNRYDSVFQSDRLVLYRILE